MFAHTKQFSRDNLCRTNASLMCPFQSISCHYASGDCHYVDVSGTSQSVISDEIKELIEKRFGKDVDFKLAVSSLSSLVHTQMCKLCDHYVILLLLLLFIWHLLLLCLSE